MQIFFEVIYEADIGDDESVSMPVYKSCDYPEKMVLINNKVYNKTNSHYITVVSTAISQTTISTLPHLHIVIVASSQTNAEKVLALFNLSPNT